MRPIIVLLLLMFSFRGFSQSGDIETIKKLNRDFLGALVNKDSAALGKVLADDFILINPGGIKRNKQENLALAVLPGQQDISVDFDTVEVRMLTSEVGLVAAWTTNVVKAHGKQTTYKICYQDVYMKRNGKWQAVAAHVTLLGGE